jgi:type II secretory pathway pseudopilin PulG
VILFRTRDPLGLILAAMTMPSMNQGHQKATQRAAILQGMALFLAVRAYETEHGQPPETLDALVPDYLPRVPEDPFDGKPFRYLRRDVPGLPPDAWAVYSVGENFTDDGGTAYGVGTHTTVWGVNPDFVWPSVGYPPEHKE